MAEGNQLSYIYMSYGTSYVVLGVLGLVANIVETTVIHRKSRKTSFGAIVASLSIADGISGIFFVMAGIGTISNTYGVASYGVIGMNFSVVASLNHVVLSVIYGAIAAFKKEQVAENWIVFGLLFTLVWGSACLYGIISVLVLKDFIVANSKIVVVYTAVSLLLYIATLHKQLQAAADQKANQPDTRCAQGSKMLLHSVLLTACSFLCYLPFAIYVLTRNRGKVVGIICDLMVALNPSLDALIYFYVSRKEKTELAQQSSEPVVSITHV